MKKKKVAVLAVQGAFIEHEKMIERLGAQVLELRQRADLEEHFEALVLPGGESTVQGKLIRELGMFELLKQRIEEGMPVLATCAGAILLAECIEGNDNAYLETLPITIRRNAYGRQLGSFSMSGDVKHLAEHFPMQFIRAPYITEVADGVEVLAHDEAGHIVGVRYGSQFAFAFHPELTEDVRIHKAFIDCVYSPKM